MEERSPVQLAEDLEQLPFDERQRAAAASIRVDLTDVDPVFVDKARRRARELLAERGVALPPA